MEVPKASRQVWPGRQSRGDETTWGLMEKHHAEVLQRFQVQEEILRQVLQGQAEPPAAPAPAAAVAAYGSEASEASQAEVAQAVREPKGVAFQLESEGVSTGVKPMPKRTPSRANARRHGLGSAFFPWKQA